MKSNIGWRLEPRYEWENSGQVRVTKVGSVDEEERVKVVDYIAALLEEFNLPVRVVEGNLDARDCGFVWRLIGDSLRSAGQIDSDLLLKKIGEARGTGQLTCGLAIIVDPKDYSFSEPDALYGVGYDDGLVLLRNTSIQAVRHEMGHMLGGLSHCEADQTCVMRWKCPTERFCKGCRNKLLDAWHLPRE